MCSTACARTAPSCGAGCRTARTSTSAATPSAWPGTSTWRCGDRRRARRHERRSQGLARRSRQDRAATSATSTERDDPYHLPYCGVGCGSSRAPRAVAARRRRPGTSRQFRPALLQRRALGDTLGLEGRLLYPEIDGRGSRGTRRSTPSRGLSRHHRRARARRAWPSTSRGQLLTEDYYAANKLMKGFIGTANIDTNSRLCMARGGRPQARLRRRPGAGCYEDFDLADLVVLVGSNLAWCHPVLFQRIEAAQRARPEIKVVVIDPRRTDTCELADLHLPLAPGSDVALFNGLLAYLARPRRVSTAPSSARIPAASTRPGGGGGRRLSLRPLRPAARPICATSSTGSPRTAKTVTPIRRASTSRSPAPTRSTRSSTATC